MDKDDILYSDVTQFEEGYLGKLAKRLKDAKPEEFPVPHKKYDIPDGGGFMEPVATGAEGGRKIPKEAVPLRAWDHVVLMELIGVLLHATDNIADVGTPTRPAEKPVGNAFYAWRTEYELPKHTPPDAENTFRRDPVSNPVSVGKTGGALVLAEVETVAGLHLKDAEEPYVDVDRIHLHAEYRNLVMKSAPVPPINMTRSVTYDDGEVVSRTGDRYDLECEFNKSCLACMVPEQFDDKRLKAIVEGEDVRYEDPYTGSEYEAKLRKLDGSVLAETYDKLIGLAENGFYRVVEADFLYYRLTKHQDDYHEYEPGEKYFFLHGDEVELKYHTGDAADVKFEYVGSSGDERYPYVWKYSSTYKRRVDDAGTGDASTGVNKRQLTTQFLINCESKYYHTEGCSGEVHNIVMVDNDEYYTAFPKTACAFVAKKVLKGIDARIEITGATVYIRGTASGRDTAGYADPTRTEYGSEFCKEVRCTVESTERTLETGIRVKDVSLVIDGAEHFDGESSSMYSGIWGKIKDGNARWSMSSFVVFHMKINGFSSSSKTK